MWILREHPWKQRKTAISNDIAHFFQFLTIFNYSLPPNFWTKHAHKLKLGMHDDIDRGSKTCQRAKAIVSFMWAWSTRKTWEDFADFEYSANLNIQNFQIWVFWKKIFFFASWHQGKGSARILIAPTVESYLGTMQKHEELVVIRYPHQLMLLPHPWSCHLF